MNRKRVLIVDDDKEFAESMAARCRSIGLDAVTACNPLTAITVIGVRPPDLICMDVEMPTGNGLSVCEFLTAEPAVSGKPVIILTGRKDQGTMRRCGELRAHYVHKSPDVWRQLRPLFVDLLKIDPEESSSESVPAQQVESI